VEQTTKYINESNQLMICYMNTNISVRQPTFET